MTNRYLRLDGMRGIAAFAVLLHHSRQYFPARLGEPHAGNAVDFFFMLSGFVLAHAYESRLRHRGAVAAFVRDRVIRLHPLLVLGAVPGAVMLIFGRVQPDAFPLLVALFAVIPLPAFWSAVPFRINGPSWSLFYELALNLVFAWASPHVATRTLAAIAGLFAILLVVSRMTMPEQTTDSWPAAFRATFAFPAGVLLYRLRDRLPPPPRLMSMLSPLVLALVLLLPVGKGGVLYDTAVRILLFPLLIHAAAAHETRQARLATLVGDLSYPVYILHIGILMVLIRLREAVGIAVPPMSFGIAFVALTIVGAYLALNCYDRPLRRALHRRLPSRRQWDAPDPVGPGTAR